MEHNVSPANQPLPLKNQILYGFSDMAGNPIYTIMISFLTFFYTDVLELNPAAVGSLILISKVFDGFSDIAAGTIVDNTLTKTGSARPWILRSAIPLAASFILLFTVPDIGTAGKLIYIFVSYNFAMSVCYTIFNAAANALPLYATNDSVSRSAAFAYRVIIGGLIQLILTVFFMNLVDLFGGNQRAWVIIAIILACITLLGSIITYFSMEEKANPKLLHAASESEKNESKTPVLVSIRALLKNKYWKMLLVLLACVLFHQVATLTVGVYYATWILEDKLLAGQVALFHTVPMLLSLCLVPFLLRKNLSKQRICVVCTVLMLTGGLLGIVSGESRVLFYASLIFRGAGYGVIVSLINGMVGDSLFYGEWKTGVSTRAIGACAFTFVQKIISGLVVAVFGMILGNLGYDGLAPAQPGPVLTFIRLFFLSAPVILYLLQLIVLHFYKLDREMPEVIHELSKNGSVY